MATKQSALWEGIRQTPNLLKDPLYSGWDTDLAPELVLGSNPDFAAAICADTEPKEVSTPYDKEISAGKNTYVYDAHTYHTKVPPDGIRLLIEHFTEPGRIVFDPFCGSGMTGVAALQAGRHALLSDISPAAAFIAFNHCTPVDHRRFMAAVRSLLDETADLQRQLYRTRCRKCASESEVLYTVWSFGVICPECDSEFCLWDAARDERPRVRDSKILSEFPCPHCGQVVRKRGLQRTKRYPVQIGYSCCARGTKEQTADPATHDFDLIADIERSGVPDHIWYPRDEFPEGVNTRQAIAAGITSIDKAYTPRALWALASLWRLALRWPEADIRAKLLFALTSLYQRVTVFSEFRFWGGSGNIANYNVPAIMNEQNVFRAFERKARTISWYFREAPVRQTALRVSVHSALKHAALPDRSVDYIFTDPPFGGNINYSEMNFLWESWLRVRTQPEEEAIINRVQKKNIDDYESLLAKAFAEARRVLKDKGWMTVVFHNSSSSVWKALQRALSRGGFAIVGTQTFDKKHGTFKQFVSENAVGYDLVLHCQKSFATAIEARPATIESITDFIRTRLADNGRSYQTEYLHVKRETEFDYRKLYAEWLKETVGQSGISLNFEGFRSLVDKINAEEF